MKKLQEKISEKTRETGIQQATALLAPRSRQEWEMHVPEVEWSVTPTTLSKNQADLFSVSINRWLFVG